MSKCVIEGAIGDCFPSNLQFIFFKFCKNCNCFEPVIHGGLRIGNAEFHELTCEHANACSRLWKEKEGADRNETN